jgi:hypothetical protein
LAPIGGGVQYRYRGLSAVSRDILSRQGEAGRFEFKETSDAVTVKVLVAAANAAAMDRTGNVTILVGVAEQTDTGTGVVTGNVVGLNELARDRGKLTSRAAETRPVPVGLTIYEENLAHRPILRLEVRPTRVPHFDSEGRRVTRHGASTRAITDEELVDLYLDREAKYFAQRFRSVSQEVMARLEALDAQTQEFADRITDVLGEVTFNAEQAAAASEEGRDVLYGVDETADRTLSAVMEIHQGAPTMEEAWYELRRRRASAFAYFKFRRHPAKQAAKVLSGLFASMPDPLEYVRVRREYEAWGDFLGVDFDATAAQWLKAADAVRRSTEPEDTEPLDLSIYEFRAADRRFGEIQRSTAAGQAGKGVVGVEKEGRR